SPSPVDSGGLSVTTAACVSDYTGGLGPRAEFARSALLIDPIETIVLLTAPAPRTVRAGEATSATPAPGGRDERALPLRSPDPTRVRELDLRPLPPGLLPGLRGARRRRGAVRGVPAGGRCLTRGTSGLPIRTTPRWRGSFRRLNGWDSSP